MCLAGTGRIESLEERDGTTMSVVNFGGVRKEVCLELHSGRPKFGEYVVCTSDLPSSDSTRNPLAARCGIRAPRRTRRGIR